MVFFDHVRVRQSSHLLRLLLGVALFKIFDWVGALVFFCFAILNDVLQIFVSDAGQSEQLLADLSTLALRLILRSIFLIV